MKYIACIKKMAIRALRNGWLQRDPFTGSSLALREVDRQVWSFFYRFNYVGAYSAQGESVTESVVKP